MELVILLPKHERLLNKKGQHAHIQSFLLKGDSNYTLIEFSRRAIILGCRNDYEGITFLREQKPKPSLKSSPKNLDQPILGHKGSDSRS